MNARSLLNKTFLLDFFSSCDLDFLCVTETWLSVGESSALLKLLPVDRCYFNSPQTSGRGGGTVTIFKQDYKCKLSQIGPLWRCPTCISGNPLTNTELHPDLFSLNTCWIIRSRCSSFNLLFRDLCDFTSSQGFVRLSTILDFFSVSGFLLY